MYQQIHFSNDDQEKSRKYQDRWITESGREFEKNIVEKIKEGAGEDFLTCDFQAGRLSILENEWDLKGISINDIDIDFPERDTFEAIDFSYATFRRVNFKKATFTCNAGGSFIRLSNCEFDDCIYVFSWWYGCTFENVTFRNCQFIANIYFDNCIFKNCKFEGCFVNQNIFSDCMFDVNTSIDAYENRTDYTGKHKLEKKDIPETYKGIKEAYASGQVYDRYREYFLKQKVAERKYIHRGIRKTRELFIELLTGYGVRPLRVLSSSLSVIIGYSLIFKYVCGISFIKSILMSAGYFATVGEVLNIFPLNWLGISESMIGICLFALLITVLSNVWFAEK